MFKRHGRVAAMFGDKKTSGRERPNQISSSEKRNRSCRILPRTESHDACLISIITHTPMPEAT
jgi:hypothetical protein